MKFLTLIIALFIQTARANQSCDLLLRVTPTSFSLKSDHPNIFVLEEMGELYVYKYDIETLADDLRLADHVFKLSDSKIFGANLVIERFDVPNARVPRQIIPEQTISLIEQIIGEPTAPFYRSEYISGRVPQFYIEEIAPNDRRKILEESRRFFVEIDRIYNWVNRNEAYFGNQKIKASFLFDNMLFKAAFRTERENTLGTRILLLEAGPNLVYLTYGMNFVVKDGHFVLIDPH